MPTPAVVELSESNGNANGGSGSPHGAGPVVQDGLSSISFGSYDDFNFAVNLHPVVFSTTPGASNYSMTKWIRIHVSSFGTSSSIGNLKIWQFSGTPIAGEVFGCRVMKGSAAGYSTYGFGLDNFANPNNLACPYTGNAAPICGGTGYDALQLSASLPGSPNIGVNDHAATAMTTGNGFTYSDYAPMCRLGITGTTPFSTGSPPNNILALAFTYDES